jgi:hypothetical protein
LSCHNCCWPLFVTGDLSATLVGDAPAFPGLRAPFPDDFGVFDIVKYLLDFPGSG